MLRRTLNLGILAHVDAGKTTLTERLLYAAGVIQTLGSVDKGTTQTDSLALEQRRGITIKAAVVSFPIDDVTVNLIDTPGHPDFIAEVERVLNVLDGVVLVISAVEGVQAQTRLLMRALQRLRLPTLLFVNKIDRRGATYADVLAAIAEKLTPAMVAMGSVRRLGTRDADFVPPRVDDTDFLNRMAATLAEHDDALLAAYVEESQLSGAQLRDALAAQTKRALVHPVFFGSAMTGAGVETLMASIPDLLPTSDGDSDAAVRGRVFKVERSPSGEKIAYVRMFAGTLRIRDRLPFGRDGRVMTGKVTAIAGFDGAAAVRTDAVSAGEIAKVSGLGEIQIGDELGPPAASIDDSFFAPPTLESVVVPSDPVDKAALYSALTQLAEQDPLINVRRDDLRQEISVSLYGEVQKEVIEATLSEEFGLTVAFRETTPICIERLRGAGAAAEVLGAQTNPFLATVGLRVEPRPPGSGVCFLADVGIGSVPLYVYKRFEDFAASIEDAVRDTLHRGVYGWEVTDCTVTLTDSGYASPSTTAGDFRKLTPLVLADAIKQIGTVVCEPIHRFRLDGPSDSLQPTLRALAHLGTAPQASAMSDSTFTVEGEIAAARMHLLQQRLGAVTHGEGAVEFVFDRYEPVTGLPPARPRLGDNPFNREEYLLRVAGRVPRAKEPRSG